MVVGARQSFQIFRQKTWFLENNRALSKFLIVNEVIHSISVLIILADNEVFGIGKNLLTTELCIFLSS